MMNKSTTLSGKTSSDEAYLFNTYGAFLTVEDICTILKVSRPFVDRCIRCGQLPAMQLGRQYRVAVQDFVKWCKTEISAHSKLTIL